MADPWQMSVLLSVLACHSNHMNSSMCGNSRVCTPLVTPVPMLVNCWMIGNDVGAYLSVPQQASVQERVRVY